MSPPTPPRITFWPPSEMIVSLSPVACVVSVVETWITSVSVPKPTLAPRWTSPLSPSTIAVPPPSVIRSWPKPPRMMLFEPALIVSSSPRAPGPVTYEKMSFDVGWFMFTSPLSPRMMFWLPALAVIVSLPTPPRIMFEPPFEVMSSCAPVAADVSIVATSLTSASVPKPTLPPRRWTMPLSPSTTAVPPPERDRVDTEAAEDDVVRAGADLVVAAEQRVGRVDVVRSRRCSGSRRRCRRG